MYESAGIDYICQNYADDVIKSGFRARSIFNICPLICDNQLLFSGCRIPRDYILVLIDSEIA